MKARTQKKKTTETQRTQRATEEDFFGKRKKEKLLEHKMHKRTQKAQGAVVSRQ